jgi:hypothetical protein
LVFIPALCHELKMMSLHLPLVKFSVVHSNRPNHAYKILCLALGSGFRDAVYAAGKKRSGMGQPVLDMVPRMSFGYYLF